MDTFGIIYAHNSTKTRKQMFQCRNVTHIITLIGRQSKCVLYILKMKKGRFYSITKDSDSFTDVCVRVPSWHTSSPLHSALHTWTVIWKEVQDYRETLSPVPCRSIGITRHKQISFHFPRAVLFCSTHQQFTFWLVHFKALQSDSVLMSLFFFLFPPSSLSS